jgi:hypothetical protein
VGNLSASVQLLLCQELSGLAVILEHGTFLASVCHTL